MYGNQSEQVNTFRYLGGLLDTKLTWNEHINKIEKKSKMLLNVMRCLKWSEWGAGTKELKNIYIYLYNNFSTVMGFRRFLFFCKQTRNKVPSPQHVCVCVWGGGGPLSFAAPYISKRTPHPRTISWLSHVVRPARDALNVTTYVINTSLDSRFTTIFLDPRHTLRSLDTEEYITTFL